MRYGYSLLTVAALSISVFTASILRPVQADAWNYDPELKPITRAEIAHTVADSRSSDMERNYMFSQAYAHGLLEEVVNECAKSLDKRPKDAVLQSTYCYALFLAHDSGDYKPQNKEERLRQQNELFYRATIRAEQIARGVGAKEPLSWRALAYVNLQGIAGGVSKGIERAEKALQLSPNDPYNHRMLAYAYLKPGTTQDRSKALEHARRATALQPKSQSAYRYQARVYFAQKNYTAAYDAFKKVWALTPPRFRDEQQLRFYEQ